MCVVAIADEVLSPSVAVVSAMLAVGIGIVSIAHSL
jgi:hypothetical protein